MGNRTLRHAAKAFATRDEAGLPVYTWSGQRAPFSALQVVHSVTCRGVFRPFISVEVAEPFRRGWPQLGSRARWFIGLTTGEGEGEGRGGKRPGQPARGLPSCTRGETVHHIQFRSERSRAHVGRRLENKLKRPMGRRKRGSPACIIPTGSRLRVSVGLQSRRGSGQQRASDPPYAATERRPLEDRHSAGEPPLRCGAPPCTNAPPLFVPLSPGRLDAWPLAKRQAGVRRRASGGGARLRLAARDGCRRMLYGGHSSYTSQQMNVGWGEHPLLALRPASGPHTPSACSPAPPTINRLSPSTRRILSLLHHWS